MRLSAWAWLLLGASLVSCAGDYPLAPTPCDDYCHATRDLQCGYYLPAACVQSCEHAGYGQPDCRAELSAALSCFDSNPDAAAQHCSHWDRPPACSAELGALHFCADLAWQRSGER